MKNSFFKKVIDYFKIDRLKKSYKGGEKDKNKYFWTKLVEKKGFL